MYARWLSFGKNDLPFRQEKQRRNKMAISKETKELADSLFIRVMSTACAKFAQEMPSGTELAELCKNAAVEDDDYWEDIPIIDEPDPDHLCVDPIQENLRLYLPG